MKNSIILSLALMVLLQPLLLQAQSTTDTLLQQATLQDVVAYALKHQPSIQQTKLDEQIAESNIKSRLADWYPQVNLVYNLQHNLQLPTSFLPDGNGNKRAIQLGVKNTSNFGFGVTQNIFNSDVLLATRTAAEVRQQARQLTVSSKIDVVTEVSKAFYNLLLTQQQVKVLDENIVRLERSLQDAYNQYKGGLVDKIDYKRAQIALNNTRADRKSAADAIAARKAYLKEIMGYPAPNDLTITYDSLQMERAIGLDTLGSVQYANRIEYQLLQTQQHLLQANVKYNKWSYLPTVSAFGNYNPTFQNEQFFNLYNNVYPTSNIGLQLAIPIFQGGKRIYNIRTAELQLKRLQWDVKQVENQINTEYAQALASYKGNLAQRDALKENMALAEEVYNTLRIQYQAGIKTYLDVIIAETDLRAAQLNYLNALYQTLASKLDLEKAAGTVQY